MITLNPLMLIEKLINEHGSSSILRERLLLIKEELAKVESDRADLITKVAELQKQLSDCTNQLNKFTAPKEYTEHMGALFKKDMDGRHMPIAFCPKCKTPLVSTPDFLIFPYYCSGCKYEIMIHDNLASIVEKLNKS